MSTPQHYRDVARAAVTDVHQQAPVLGYLRLGNAQHVYLFPAIGDGRAWFDQRHEFPGGYDYVAVFVAADLSAPIVEDFGSAVTVSGDDLLDDVNRLVAALKPFVEQGDMIGMYRLLVTMAQQGDPAAQIALAQVPDEQRAAIDEGLASDAQVGHWLLPLALGIPTGAYAGYRYRKWQEANPGKMVPWVSGDDDYDEDVDVGAYPWVSIQDLGPPRFMPYGPWLNIVGDDADAARRRAWPIARALIRSAIDEVRGASASHPSAAYVWSLEGRGGTQIVPLESPDQALSYARELIHAGDSAVVAAFDRTSPHWPNPVSWSKSDDPAADRLIAQQLARHGVSPSVSGPVGEALDVLRRQASAAADELPGRVIGVSRDGNGKWQIKQFRSADDADDWFGRATRDATAFTYAAYFDKSDPTYPAPLNETIGRAKSQGRLAA